MGARDALSRVRLRIVGGALAARSRSTGNDRGRPRTPLLAAFALSVVCLLAASCTSSGTVASSDPEPTSGNLDTEVDERVMEVQAGFGLDLLSESMDLEEGNVVLAPLSVATALAVAWNGTAGSTSDEFAEVLGLEDVPLGEVNSAYADLLASLAENPEGVEFTIANSLWGDDGLDFGEDFLQTNEEYYAAEVRTVDSAGTQSAGEAIGDWLSDATDGKIEETPAGVSPSDLMHLINALHFFAEWENMFDAERTGMRDFTLGSGTEIEIEMLSDEREAQVLMADDIAMARLPYLGGGQAAYVLLPPESVPADDFTGDLTPAEIDAVYGRARNCRAHVRDAQAGD